MNLDCLGQVASSTLTQEQVIDAKEQTLASPDYLLKVQNLTKCHLNKQVKFQAKIESLILKAGDSLGITGPSGCGKSSLLEVIALLSQPEQVQEFSFINNKLTKLNSWQEYNLAELLFNKSSEQLGYSSTASLLAALRRSFLGFIHQGGGLYPFLTASENICLPLKLNGYAEKQCQTRVEELLNFLHLEQVASSYPEKLSYGERQRCAVARALATKPSLILADEPTSALDPETAYSTLNLLLEGAKQSQSALIIVSHDYHLLQSAKIPILKMALDKTDDQIENLDNLAEQANLFNQAKQDKQDQHKIISYVLEPYPVAQADLACQLTYKQKLEQQQKLDQDNKVNQDKTRQAKTSQNKINQDKTSQAQLNQDRVTINSEIKSYSKLQSLANLSYLAWRDFIYERSLSFCTLLAFAAALTPLMLLCGLRFGIINTLSNRLLDNPQTLAINPYSNQRYTEADIQELSKIDGVAFILPQIRILASTVYVTNKQGKTLAVDCLASRADDPLLKRYGLTLEANSAVISQELARSLADNLEELTISINRRHQGKSETVNLKLKLQGILPDAADWQAHIYLPLPLLLQIERFRDGLLISDWQDLNLDNLTKTNENNSSQTNTSEYASFRMYVQDLESVITVRNALKERGIDAYTFAREVETLQGLRYALNAISLLVGGVTLVGMLLSLGALALANVRRKAYLFAQSYLLGFKQQELFILPLIQLMYTIFFASIFSLILYLSASYLLELIASPWLASNESVCHLPLFWLSSLYLASFILTSLASLAACKQVLQLKANEILRRDA